MLFIVRVLIAGNCMKVEYMLIDCPDVKKTAWDINAETDRLKQFL